MAQASFGVGMAQGDRYFGGLRHQASISTISTPYSLHCMQPCAALPSWLSQRSGSPFLSPHPTISPFCFLRPSMLPSSARCCQLPQSTLLLELFHLD